MRRCLVLLITAMLTSIVGPRSSFAGDVLQITFDDPHLPFVDGSPSGHISTGGTITDGNIKGNGVYWSNAAPRSPAGGGYGVFDGGSFLLVQPSEEFVFPPHQNFTIRFWFKSPGIDRGPGLPTKYRTRMHPLRLGQDLQNLDIDFDDYDGGHGLWTYWRGGGIPFIWSKPGSIGQFTDGRWHHYWLVREKIGTRSLLKVYVGDEDGNYQRIGEDEEKWARDDGQQGLAGAPIRIGCLEAPFSPGVPTGLCWFGALDDIRISNEALYPCLPGSESDTTLCLRNGRFRVGVTWRDFTGNTGTATAKRISNDSGYFTFFGQSNAEVLVKILDTCSPYGNYWVFSSHMSNVEYTITVMDTQTGQTRTVFNPLGNVAPSVLSTGTIFTECGGGSGAGLPQSEHVDTSVLPPNGPSIVDELVNPAAISLCVENASTMCLNNGRFRVHATFADSQGNRITAKQWPLTGDSGRATFFADGNTELFIKVLDACERFGSYWVFASGLTNVGVDLYVEDSRTGKVWHVSNPQGREFTTVLETQTAFTDCD